MSNFLLANETNHIVESTLRFKTKYLPKSENNLEDHSICLDEIFPGLGTYT